MVVPFIVLILVIIGVVWFLAGAAKRKNHGRDLGDTRAGNPVHHPDAQNP